MPTGAAAGGGHRVGIAVEELHFAVRPDQHAQPAIAAGAAQNDRAAGRGSVVNADCRPVVLGTGLGALPYVDFANSVLWSMAAPAVA